MDGLEDEAERLGPGQVRLRVHGAPRPFGLYDRVSGEVFAAKLTLLIKALKEADKAVNGAVQYDYKIANLTLGSAVVVLSQEPVLPLIEPTGESSLSALDDCISAISEGKPNTARNYGSCPRLISRLASGADKKFGYGELWLNELTPFRVDGFLAEQAKAAEKPSPVTISSRLFKGFAEASFDGVIKRADLRGALPQITLMIGGGARELDCICHPKHVEEIRNNLDRRARISGRTFYDGVSGLPRRIEVKSIRAIKPAGDFRRWKGAFTPFEVPELTDETS